jgi:hypothetical protein
MEPALILDQVQNRTQIRFDDASAVCRTYRAASMSRRPAFTSGVYSVVTGSENALVSEGAEPVGNSLIELDTMAAAT